MGRNKRRRPKRSRDDPNGAPPKKKARGWESTPRESEQFMNYYKVFI